MNFDFIRFTHPAGKAADASLTQAGWQPPADVYEDSHGWLIKFELAGVRPQDIKLTIRGRRLTVRGARRDWNVEAGRHFHRLEISCDQFQRTLELPCELDAYRIATEYRDGMLLVRLTCEEQT
jgi:HSP20 family protein